MSSLLEEKNFLVDLGFNKDLCKKIRQVKKKLNSNYSKKIKEEFNKMANDLYNEIYGSRHSDVFIGELHRHIGELFSESDNLSDKVPKTNIISNPDEIEEFYCGYTDTQGNQHQFVGFWDKVLDDDGNEVLDDEGNKVLEQVMFLRLVIPFDKFLRWLESTEVI